MNLNHTIFYFLNGLAGQSAFIDSVIVFFAVSLPWIMIVFLFIYLIFLRRTLLKFSMMSITTIAAVLVTDVLKWAIFRHPRPFAALPEVTQLVFITPYDSFPSGHATVFAALATGMFIYNRPVGVFFIVAALLIGAARVAAGVHYPIDILTGYLIGFAVTFFSYKLWHGLSSRIREFIS